MYPPLFGLTSKIAPAGGDTVNGIYFPPGTEVATCFAGVTYRKDIFGQDVEIFRPERFLDADPSVNNHRVRTTELVFGSGRFSCLGRNIGMMELAKVFAEVSHDLLFTTRAHTTETSRTY